MTALGRFLSTLLQPGLATAEADKAAKEVTSRMGSTAHTGDILRQLCARLAPGILPLEQLSALLALAEAEAGTFVEDLRYWGSEYLH